MDIIVKPVNNDLEKYIDLGINTFLLPLNGYAVEYSNYYKLEEIKNIRNKYKNISIFVSINKNIFNNEIEELKNILKELDKISIKAIFFYDAAIVKLKKDLNLNLDLVWNQTFMVTNYKTCDYYYDKGVEYALLSKEITKEEILQIIKKTKIKPIVELVSYPTAAFSKRHLVSNYYKHYNLKPDNNIKIIEPKSKQEYIVVEDKNGVSFINNKIMNLSKILKELIDNNLQYIYLKGDLIDEDTFIEAVKNIKYYVDNYKNINDLEYSKWLRDQEKLLGSNTNFLHRKTIYKVK